MRSNVNWTIDDCLISLSKMINTEKQWNSKQSGWYLSSLHALGRQLIQAAGRGDAAAVETLRHSVFIACGKFEFFYMKARKRNFCL